MSHTRPLAALPDLVEPEQAPTSRVISVAGSVASHPDRSGKPSLKTDFTGTPCYVPSKQQPFDGATTGLFHPKQFELIHPDLDLGRRVTPELQPVRRAPKPGNPKEPPAYSSAPRRRHSRTCGKATPLSPAAPGHRAFRVLYGFIVLLFLTVLVLSALLLRG